MKNQSENYVGKNLKKRTLQESLELGLNTNPDIGGTLAKVSQEKLIELARRSAEEFKKLFVSD